MADWLIGGASGAALTVALAHGAGAPMDSPFMNYFADALMAAGVRVVRFEFPYMAERRLGGLHRPPDRPNVLLDVWRSVVDHFGPERLIIGGKSLGGRMASMVADPLEVGGVICLGYPFHPPGKPEQRRIEHLRTLSTEALILQGTRDPFGARDEVGRYPLSHRIRFHWLEDGDHDLSPRVSSGRTTPQNWEEAAHGMLTFIGSLTIV